MKSCRVAQSIAAVPAAVQGSWNQGGRRMRLVLLPRLDRGAAFFQGRKMWIRYDLLTGARAELEIATGRAELAELEQLAKAEAAKAAPEMLRGRWTASAGLKDGTPVVELRRTIGYVTTETRLEAGVWKVLPFKRRPAWFSAAEDWPQTVTAAPSPRVAIGAALDQARAGITLACTRRDSTRREPPAPPVPRAKKPKPAPAAAEAPKPTRGSQRKLF